MIEGKPPASVIVRAMSDLLNLGVHVRVGAYDKSTNRGWRLAYGKWLEEDDTQSSDEHEYDLMVMRMEQESAQRLFEDLWRAGFRPKEQPDMDRLLAEAHRHNELLVRIIEALAAK